MTVPKNPINTCVDYMGLTSNMLIGFHFSAARNFATPKKEYIELQEYLRNGDYLENLVIAQY